MKKTRNAKEMRFYYMSTNTDDSLSDRDNALNQNRQKFFNSRSNTSDHIVSRILGRINTMVNIMILILLFLAIGMHIWQ